MEHGYLPTSRASSPLILLAIDVSSSQTIGTLAEYPLLRSYRKSAVHRYENASDRYNIILHAILLLGKNRTMRC